MLPQMPETSNSRAYVLAFMVLIILLAVSGALLLLSRTPPVTITIHPPAPTSTAPPTETPSPITVFVTGAVAEPESLIQLPRGSRVVDVLEAVGGLTEYADKKLVNLAAIVRDGDQIHIRSVGDSVYASSLPTPSGGRRVHLNTASQAQLESLPGIGPATAQRIIEYRELVGEISSLTDLDMVSGIGPATIDKLKDLVAFD